MLKEPFLRRETQSDGMVGIEVVAQACLVIYLRPATSDGCKGMDIKQVLADVQLLI